MEWISVEDRLPEYEEKILMCCKIFCENSSNDGYSSLFVKAGKRNKTDFNGECFKCVDDREYRKDKHLYIITHWMPLPQPPTKADKEG